MLIAVYGSVFLAVLLAVDGGYRLLASRRAWRDALARRMRGPEPSLDRAGETGTLRRHRNEFLRWPFAGVAGWFDHVMRQAGLTPGPGLLIVGGASGLLAAAVVMVAILAGGWELSLYPGGLAMGAAFAFLAGAGAPLAYALRRAHARLRAFEAQLPDALDLIARGLRAGHPLSVAMASVAREFPDPLGGEFEEVVNEMTYGLDLRDAMRNLSGRVDLPDLRFVVVAMSIQHETGGNLAEVLHGLTSIMRARMRLNGKIRALTAEARLSGKLLALMPLLFAGLVLAGNPDFYSGVSDDPLFFPLLGGAFALEAAGIVIMRRLTRLKA